MTPTISVAMSVFNGEEYLSAAIDSILAQTFSDFEFIIVDDGSTDHSAAIVRGYDDPRIVLLSQENRGVAAALNHALSRANGVYIARQDADDVSMSDRFALQVQWLETHPEIAVLGTGALLIDPQGRPFSRVNPFTRHQRLVKELRRGICPLVHGSVMCRRQALLHSGPYNPAFGHMQDVELWLRMSLNHRLGNLRTMLYQLRKHDSSITQRERIDLRIKAFAKTGKLGPQTREEDWISFSHQFDKEVAAGRWDRAFAAENRLRDAQKLLASGRMLRGVRSAVSAFVLNPALAVDVPVRMGSRVRRALAL